MTKFQALFVKYLRIRCNGSWRFVAGKYSNRYEYGLPFNYDSSWGGNQLIGMDLCNKAMDILEEEVEDGWN
jgi:hypothetical protein